MSGARRLAEVVISRSRWVRQILCNDFDFGLFVNDVHSVHSAISPARSLRHNAQLVRKFAPRSKVWGTIKAQGYGE